MGIITLNGKSSAGIFEVETPPAYEVPERIYEVIPVPGRNGDVIIDTGAFKNTVREYAISYGKEGGDHAALSQKFTDWLFNGVGYLRLEDTYEPDYFKLAYYDGDPEIANVLNQAGKATLQFNRKPERFLKTGENIIVVTNVKEIINPTQYNSSPLIRVNGNGEGAVNIGSYRVEIKNISNWIYIDSDIEDAYKNDSNLNVQVTCIGGFPRLVPGSNTISYEGGVTGLQITPRWWTI